MAQWQTFQKHLSTHQQQPMSNTKEQRAQKLAIIEATVKEQTHKLMHVKMPVELHAQIKAEAEQLGMKLGRYVCGLIEKGKEGA